MKKSQRSALRLLAATTLVIIASAGTAVTAQAAYIVNATETGGDVVFSGSGSIDITAWSQDTAFNASANFTGIDPTGYIGLGPTTSTTADRYLSATFVSAPSTIGTGSSFKIASAGTGDVTTIDWAGGNQMFLPRGYTSGSPLTATGTYSGQTFSSLGLTPGTYEWTWGSGSSADSYTLNVGAVPIPAAVWLFGSGLLGLVGVARRKARA